MPSQPTFAGLRLLFICSRRFDYLQDLTYAGLVQCLGKDQVLDWPRRPGFHLPLKGYPRNLGYVSGLPLFSATPRSFGVDAVVVAACKPDAVSTYLKLLPSLPRDVPHVWLDGGDRPELGGDLERLGRPDFLAELARVRPFDIVLKRELLAVASQGGGTDTETPDYAKLCPSGWPLPVPSRVVPFPLAVRSDLMPPRAEDKAYEVVFWASDNCPDRHRAFELLAGRYDCDANGSVPRRTPREFGRQGKAYLTEMSRARLAVNVRGTGWDTLRFWEMLAMGTTVLSQKLPLLLPEPPTQRQELVWLKADVSDLLEEADYYLAHDRERAAIGGRGRAWVLAHHTHVARARQLLALLGQ